VPERVRIGLDAGVVGVSIGTGIGIGVLARHTSVHSPSEVQ
jgi:hypothetical protein